MSQLFKKGGVGRGGLRVRFHTDTLVDVSNGMVDRRSTGCQLGSSDEGMRSHLIHMKHTSSTAHVNGLRWFRMKKGGNGIGRFTNGTNLMGNSLELARRRGGSNNDFGVVGENGAMRLAKHWLR